MKNRILLILSIFLITGTSCNRFLDLVPDDIASLDHAFANRYEAEGFLYGCYSYLPNLCNAAQNPGLLGGGEIWFNQPSDFDAKMNGILRGELSTIDVLFNYWSGNGNGNDKLKHIYRGINDCHLFFSLQVQ